MDQIESALVKFTIKSIQDCINKCLYAMYSYLIDLLNEETSINSTRIQNMKQWSKTYKIKTQQTTNPK